MKKLFVFVVVFSLLLITCEVEEKEKKDPLPSAKFWAQNISTSTFYQIDAELLCEGTYCKVWAEKGSGVTEATAKSVADEYAANIYIKMMNTFGYQINDKDLGKVNTMQIAHYFASGKTSGAKLTILLLDIKDGYKTEGDPFVAGYFYPYDFYKNDPNYPDYKSNELDMIYLDTYPSVIGSASTYTTLAHEMQHLMNFVSTVLFRENLMDTWIDEGLSAAAEWVYSGQHPEIRWKYYNADPSELIAKGNNFFVWDNHGGESPLANLDDYATVYLLFQWLRLQSGNPDDIYYDIHTSEFYDYKAVTTAENINNSHKDKWQLLLRDWHAANYTNAVSGLYGYKNDPILKDIKAPIVPAGTTSLHLFPGEGVYSPTPTAESVPSASGYINYAGLSSTGLAPSNTTGFAKGARLTYNINTDINGDYSTGSTTGFAPSGNKMPDGGGAARVADLMKIPGQFKVDAGYFLKNRNSGAPYNKNKNTLKFDRSTLERVFIDE